MRDISPQRVIAINVRRFSLSRTSYIKEIIIHPSSAILPLFHYVCCLLCEAFDRHQKAARLLRSINKVFVPFVKNICNKTIHLLYYEHNKRRSCNYTATRETQHSFSASTFFPSINLNIIHILYCSCLYIIMLLFLCALSGDGIRRRCCCALGFFSYC